MKIVELRAENIKRLVAVSIKPDGNMVEITGKNGAGKTSVLDSIWWALEGKENIQAAPIRKGEKEGKISLDLGELRVTRTFTAKEGGGYTTSIRVEQGNGARFPSPQGVLDNLLGELTFDPLAFSRMDPKKQFETLKGFVPGVDFDAIDKANKVDFDARTDVNRRARELRAQAAGILLPLNPPTEAVDENALVDEMQKAGDINADIERRKAARAKAAEDIERLLGQAADIQAGTAAAITDAEARRDRELADIDREIKRLQDRATAVKQEAVAFADRKSGEDQKAAADCRSQADALQKRLDEAPELPAPVDVAGIRSKLDAARQTNEIVGKAQRKAAIEADAAKLEEQSKQLTASMARRNDDKMAAIASAKMPVAGLEFGDGEILLNGVPFDQGSDAEKLRASIAIAAAMNPKLRVIRVRDGSLLDRDARAILAKFAEENDQQIWMETVQSDNKSAVVIVDGMVAEDQQEKAA